MALGAPFRNPSLNLGGHQGPRPAPPPKSKIFTSPFTTKDTHPRPINCSVCSPHRSVCLSNPGALGQAARPDRPRYARLLDRPIAGPLVEAIPAPTPPRLYGQIPGHLGAKPPGRIGPGMRGSMAGQTPTRSYKQVLAQTLTPIWQYVSLKSFRPLLACPQACPPICHTYQTICPGVLPPKWQH